MEFLVQENEDKIEVKVKIDDEIKASASCFYRNTPIKDEKNIGCIGDFEVNDFEIGCALLNKCEEILKEKNISYVVGPMNGNTWKKYRTMKSTTEEPPFLLENVNPIEYNEIFLKSNYEEIHTYTSTKGTLEDAYNSKALESVEESLKEQGVAIKKFDKSKAFEDLRKIFNISKIAFPRNPLYAPIEEDEFLKQYEAYIDMCEEEFILIAEKDGKEIGFAFCIPNFIEMKMGKKMETLIVKTVAVLPEYENYALGNVLLKKISEKAKEKDFKNWIFAFMYSNNTSQKMAKRNNTSVIREYSIYGKEI